MSKLSGFSKILGRKAELFVPLNTSLTAGRPIFIYSPLLSKLDISSDAQIQMVVHKLKSLSANAGGMTSFSNTQNATEHKSQIGSALVRYKVFMATGDADFSAGVYILDLETTNYRDGEPGLYIASKVEDEWNISTEKQLSINTKYAAVNGLCESVKQAGQEIMPAMLEQAYDSSKFGQNTISAEGYTLSYNPPSLYANGKQWKTPRQKKWSKKYAAKLLSRQMFDAQRRGQEVLWAVHGDGAEIMLDALTLSTAKSLDKHTMLFLAPTVPMSGLVEQTKRVGAKLHHEVMKIHPDDMWSRFTQSRDGAKLKRALGSIKGFEDKALELGEDAVADAFSVAGLGVSMGAVAFGVGAFVLAPALPVITAGGAIATALGAYGTYDKLRAYRNMAVNKSTDARINPHMHPFKNRVQLDIYAKKHTGGALQSFAASLKALIGK